MQFRRLVHTCEPIATSRPIQSSPPPHLHPEIAGRPEAHPPRPRVTSPRLCLLCTDGHRNKTTTLFSIYTFVQVDVAQIDGVRIPAGTERTELGIPTSDRIRAIVTRRRDETRRDGTSVRRLLRFTSPYLCICFSSACDGGARRPDDRTVGHTRVSERECRGHSPGYTSKHSTAQVPIKPYIYSTRSRQLEEQCRQPSSPSPAKSATTSTSTSSSAPAPSPRPQQKSFWRTHPPARPRHTSKCTTRIARFAANSAAHTQMSNRRLHALPSWRAARRCGGR